MTTKTREEILKIAIQKWRTYNSIAVNSIDSLHCGNYMVIQNDNTWGTDVSINDILFWESNFFEILFGEEDICEECEVTQTKSERSMWCWSCGWYKFRDVYKYHKMMCSISPDKLAYLNSVLD